MLNAITTMTVTQALYYRKIVKMIIVALDEDEKETDPPVDKEHRTSEAPAE